jgi:hypothetical protein
LRSKRFAVILKNRLTFDKKLVGYLNDEAVDQGIDGNKKIDTVKK